ncbi:MAG: hypothetical protein IIX62_02605, partial [Peptococcaceae bacterium]|nr:hypothetical protein [Peptococcaceae bacterium]
QYMEIASVSNEKNSGGYRIFFISHGIYDVNGGHLISGIKHSRPRENCVQYPDKIVRYFAIRHIRLCVSRYPAQQRKAAYRELSESAFSMISCQHLRKYIANIILVKAGILVHA